MLRVIGSKAYPGGDGSADVVPADPLKHPEHGVRITGATVNLRTGPGTGYGIAKVGKQGEIYEEVDTSGWRAILVGKEVYWVSDKMSEKV